MDGDVTSVETILRVQGDRVLTYWRHADTNVVEEVVLTFVRVVDVDGAQLRLANRSKSHKPDWPVSQRLLEAIGVAEENKLNCKWKLRAAL